MGAWRVSPWLPAVAAVAIGLVVFLLWEVRDGVHALLAGLGALIALAGAARACASRLRPVAAVFLIFWFAWLGVAPIVQLTFGQVAWGDTSALADPAVVTQALVMNDVALVAFLVGGIRRGRSGVAAPDLPVVLPGSRADPVRGWVLAGLVIALLVVAPVAIQANGGIATYFTSRSERGQTLAMAGSSMSAAGGLQYAVVKTLPVALSVSITLIALARFRSGGTSILRRRGIDLATLLLGLVAMLVFANPLSNTRFIALLGLGALAMALLQPRSRGAAKAFAAIGFVVTFLGYPLAEVFRRGSWADQAGIAATTFTGKDFDGFQQVINTIQYVRDLGITGGAHLISATAYFIPRSIWENKAIPASLDVAAHANYVFVDLSEPLHAEFYLEFGWSGLIIGMLLIGALAAAADRAWLERPDSRFAMCVPVLALSMLGMIRGPLGSLTPVYLTLLVLMAVAFRRAPRSRVLKVQQAGERPSEIGARAELTRGDIVSSGAR